jgi:predicted metal-dependent phosphoesterase TrpH
MTEHAEYFDEQSVLEYKAECEELSDDKFVFVPGLEYTCDQRMHVLGYGVTELVSTTDPQKVISHIKQVGGVSVIAHPMDSAFAWIETFAELPQGIETWNSKYDGRYGPRPGTFQLLERLQTRHHGMMAFYGVDFHWKRQFRHLYTSVECESVTRDQVLAALAKGQFTCLKDNLRLPSNGRLSTELLNQLGARHYRSMKVRRFTKRVKKIADRFGATIPAPIKGQLRRIF